MLDLEPKSTTHPSVRKKRGKNKAACNVGDGDEEATKRKSPKKKEKCENKKWTKNPKSSKAQAMKQWTVQNWSPSKGSPARSSLVKGRGKVGMCGGVHAKDSPSSSSEEDPSPITNPPVMGSAVSLWSLEIPQRKFQQSYRRRTLQETQLQTKWLRKLALTLHPSRAR